MAEMQWYAATDSGRFDGTAAITPRSGAVCLRAELPAGVLQNAVAVLPWTMAHEEKLFMNGYQTWTACPELGKWDRQHGVERVPKFLLEKYSFDRYGDYHFVPYSGKRGREPRLLLLLFPARKDLPPFGQPGRGTGLYDFFL